MKKQIVFVVYHLVCGGVESALLDLIHLLNPDKYDITVFCIYGGGEWEQKFRDDGIKVLTSSSNIKRHTNPFKRLGNSIRARRINYALANGGKNLLKWATGKKYDIAIAYHIGSEFHDVCFSNGAKSIKYIHGSVISNHNFRKEITKTENNLSNFDKVICVSKNVQQELLSIIPLENTCYCYNPIDAQLLNFKANDANSSFLPPKYICAVGRFVKIKGFDRLISCFSKIKSRGIDAKLVLVGDGEERAAIENEICLNSMEDSVILVGYSDNPYPYIKNSMFLVCSSYSEGMPVVVMESLCLGVPVVSSYKPAEELFDSLPCGIVTEVDDDSLTQGMLDMFDENYRVAAKKAALSRKKYFSNKNLIEKVENIYDSL